jgi:hypothetical protein
MTREERAEKWFRGIPNAELISMEEKMDICDKAARDMMVDIFLMSVVHCIVLIVTCGKIIFDLIVGLINYISGEDIGIDYHIRIVYMGVIIVFAIVILPLIIAILHKNKYIKSEAEKVIKAIEKNKANEKYNEDFYNDMEEGYLQFDNFNFKLAIIQELMYDTNVLQPEFDIYEFAKEYKGEEIDTESDTVIEPALEYFKNLQIPKSLAKEVGSFYMDGGNEVYMNIIPQWDGEDGYFDLNDVSLTELRQFPNLTEATILTGDFDKIKKIFDAAGIKVELL